MKTYTHQLKRSRRETLWSEARMPNVPGVELRHAVSQGLQVEVLNNITRALGMQKNDFIKFIGINGRTLQRRHDRLSSEESEAVTRYVTAYDMALSLFDYDKDKTNHWMNTPARALGEETPNEALKTETGARDVVSIIEGIQYGVVM